MKNGVMKILSSLFEDIFMFYSTGCVCLKNVSKVLYTVKKTEPKVAKMFLLVLD
jgi:hypothetical protein